jgi:iron(III) transport system ATP-binding protein
MAVSIRLEQVTKRFGTTLASDHVSLAIEPGEIFFLLGPSGCGKTTVLRAIAGFCPPDGGRIFIGDEDITDLPPHRRDTGMVFQSYALWPHMTVAENVAFGLEMRRLTRGETADRVAEALRMVRMEDRAGQKPNQLSGGQQQRVALARALVIRPRCLLLDEPLSNLDAKLRLEMRSEIRRICKEAGLTAVYVTHDQKEALSVADRLAVMDKGRVCQVGPPDGVYKRPNSRFVAGFIGETNLVEGRLLRNDGGGCAVETAVGRFASSAAAPEGVAPGGTVTVSVRPEAIRLSGPADAHSGSGENEFHGLLKDTVYLGETAQHTVDVGGGTAGAVVSVRAFELNPRMVGRERDLPVKLSVDASDVAVLGG